MQEDGTPGCLPRVVTHCITFDLVAYQGIMAPAQVPFLSGIEAARQGIARDGLPRMARKFVAGLHDRARAAVGLSPGYLKVRTGCRAMLIVLRSFPGGYLGVAVVP